MSATIVVGGLVKRYGEHEALSGISFTVEAGEVFALLGPNGAGKTTTVEILEGHRRRSDGRVEVLGFDPDEGGEAMRRRIGIVLQSSGMDRELTPRELLTLYATVYSRPRPVDEVIATLLPLAFFSNVFIPLEDVPQWIETLGDIFPLKPFVTAFSAPFHPFAAGLAFEWKELAVVAAWGVGGALLALRLLRWDPAGEGPKRLSFRHEER